ncbi:EID1-like F-box protein 3 [Nicotiana tabacum]|uniref:EID1-like F-box protein 3 n=2 Tax=Nicotiana TaxID=4085 RepID=A0A1S4AMP4_TOBAC|nr:PREDICTED: EID1-like F-box protein 3 [Nicotiana sylvestris]XP_016477992.1 PREDICTED: EID1-like F-box protein 3 [Nicotiana tabacum]
MPLPVADQIPVGKIRMSDNHSKKRLFNSAGDSSESEGSGIYDERILMPVFASINWDIRTLCQMSCVNRKLRAVAKRILWREMCVYRAPQMITALTDGSPSGRIGGGWQAMAKLMFFCNGCRSSRHFQVGEPAPGHFVKTSRFSKTSGRSFLVKKCRNDLLYVSDPCEHPTGDKDDDLGIFRGVFWGFMRSRTRACLIRRQVELEERIKCPFCGARVWSMTAARLVPKSAARRLGSMESGLEYFVCVNGHLHGACWLVPLSSDEGEEKVGDEDEDEGEDSSEEAFDGDYFYRGNQIVRNGQMGLSMV